MTIVYIIIGAILSWVLYVEALALTFISKLFNYLMVSLDRNIATFDAVQLGWVTVRDVFNMFFIFFLLIIAFATILRVQNWQYKQLLPRLIIAILLVNFSRTICAFFIEISNVMMRTFTFGLAGRDLSSTLLANLGMDKLTSVSTALSNTQIKDASMAAGMFMVTAFVGVFVLALTAVCVILITRVVALMFLTIFSPAAFVLNILPKTQQYSSKWWDEFLKYIIYGPATTFLVFLAVRFSVFLKGKSTLQNFSSTPGIKNQTAQQIDRMLFISNFNLDDFLTLVLVIGFLFGVVLMVRGLGSFGSAALFSAASGALGAGLGFASKMPARITAGTVGRSLAKGNKGLIGRAVGFAAGGIGGLIPRSGTTYGERRQDIASRAGDAVRFASPSLMIDAARKTWQDIDTRAKAGAAEYVQRPFRSVFRLPQANNEEVNEKMKDIELQFPSKSPGAVISHMKSAIRPGGRIGNLAQVQAGFQTLMATNSIDEFFNRTQSDPTLKAAAFGSDYESTDHFKRNGYKNNIANRIKVMENMFGQETAKSIADNYASALSGKGAYDWSGMIEYDGDRREWVGHNKNFASTADLENYREAEVAKNAARSTARQSAKKRANLANSTVFDSDTELSRHELMRAVGGYNSVGDNAEIWKNMSAEAKRKNENPEIIKSRNENAAFSIVMNTAFDGKTLGSHSYSTRNARNGASLDVVINKKVQSGKSNTQIIGDVKGAVRQLSLPSGQKKLEKMLKDVDPEYFSNPTNLSAAVSQIQSGYSSINTDDILDGAL